MDFEKLDSYVTDTVSEAERFDRKKIIITGGTEGIGREITEEFLLNDNAVAICARSQDKLDAMKHAHNDASTFIAERIDLGERQTVKQFAEEVISDLGGLDTLILNAAAFDFQFKSSGLSEDEVNKKVFQVNEVANVTLITHLTHPSPATVSILQNSPEAL